MHEMKQYTLAERLGVGQSNYTSYIGIDPGKDGAVVLIKRLTTNSTIVVTRKMPLLANKEYDARELMKILKDFSKDGDCMCIMEDVHSIFGASAKSNFSFGMGVGIITAAVIAAEIPFIKVSPKKWQKVCFEGIREVKKVGPVTKGQGSTDTKKMAAVACDRLYPKIDLRGSERSKVPHKGIVDALLIAHYGRMTY